MTIAAAIPAASGPVVLGGKTVSQGKVAAVHVAQAASAASSSEPSFGARWQFLLHSVDSQPEQPISASDQDGDDTLPAQPFPQSEGTVSTPSQSRKLPSASLAASVRPGQSQTPAQYVLLIQTPPGEVKQTTGPGSNATIRVASPHKTSHTIQSENPAPAGAAATSGNAAQSVAVSAPASVPQDSAWISRPRSSQGVATWFPAANPLPAPAAEQGTHTSRFFVSSHAAESVESGSLPASALSAPSTLTSPDIAIAAPQPDPSTDGSADRNANSGKTQRDLQTATASPVADPRVSAEPIANSHSQPLRHKGEPNLIQGQQPISAHPSTASASSPHEQIDHTADIAIDPQPHAIVHAASSNSLPNPAASIPVSRSAISAGTGDSAIRTNPDTISALDAEPVAPPATWIHSGATHAEAGYLDSALGWVAVRADAGGDTLHASIVPSSPEAAQVLSSHLTGLNSYLADHHGTATQVTVAAPESTRSFDANSGLNPSDRQSSQQHGHQPRQDEASSSATQNQSDSPRTADSALDPPAAIVETLAIPTRAGSHISVIA